MPRLNPGDPFRRAGAADLVPGGVGAQGGQEPAAPRYQRRRRPRGPDRDAKAGCLAGLGALIVGVHNTEGLDHYAVAMKDPEGNKFDIN
jgi:hypothetical protein